MELFPFPQGFRERAETHVLPILSHGEQLEFTALVPLGPISRRKKTRWLKRATLNNTHVSPLLRYRTQHFAAATGPQFSSQAFHKGNCVSHCDFTSPRLNQLGANLNVFRIHLQSPMDVGSQVGLFIGISFIIGIEYEDLFLFNALFEA